ncbi:hypothetical protein NCPPB3778_69 [Rathayibacter phage NCPPB3778]|nr:hypothetical protein NCPPB3778_69 [Rathayibacter phage NCPPB3778]
MTSYLTTIANALDTQYAALRGARDSVAEAFVENFRAFSPTVRDGALDSLLEIRRQAARLSEEITFQIAIANAGALTPVGGADDR